MSYIISHLHFMRMPFIPILFKTQVYQPLFKTRNSWTITIIWFIPSPLRTPFDLWLWQQKMGTFKRGRMPNLIQPSHISSSETETRCLTSTAAWAFITRFSNHNIHVDAFLSKLPKRIFSSFALIK